MTSETTESYLLSSPMEESVGLSPPPVRAPPPPPPTPAPPRGRGRRNRQNRKRKRQAPPDSAKTLTVS